jgi:hypothetical protein
VWPGGRWPFRFAFGAEDRGGIIRKNDINNMGKNRVLFVVWLTVDRFTERSLAFLKQEGGRKRSGRSPRSFL